MGRKVAELNTLSDGKGITGIRFFNEMEDTNESTNLRKLADVWMSKNRCCQGHRNRSAVRVTRITVDIGRPSQVLLLPILCRAAFYCRIIAHWRSGQEELVRS